MNKQLNIGKWSISRDLFIFLIINVLLGVVVAVESTSMANRLFEDLNFTIMQRSLLEAPKELPGLLTVIMIGMLNGFSDIRIAAIANILGGIGLLFFGLVPPEFVYVLITLVIFSTGQHLYMPLTNSISMDFAKDGNYGKRIGEIQGLSNFAIILASATLFIVYKYFKVSYSLVFLIAGLAMIFAGILFLFMHQGHSIKSSQRFVFKKEYKLYYSLSLVNGARKQITMTFVPWLIIDTFSQPVTTIALLFFILCVINIFFKPFLGGFIDKFGERLTLRLEAIFMGLVCLGLAFAKTLFPFEIALIIVSVCYILDNMLLSASMARATYVRKISKDNSEIARTLSMGQSIDHLISMFIPILAGYIWYSNGVSGYIYVFLGGILLSAINYFFASGINLPTKSHNIA